MINICIFASGSGTNMERICEFFETRKDVSISLELSNNNDAFVLERTKNRNIPSFVFNKTELKETDIVLKRLLSVNADLIVLAGFLWLIPQNILAHFPNKIINIHPALLPKFGGKGMYGMNVHKAVIESNEIESGITIHLVNEKYDDGEILFQAKCEVELSDTPERLAEKIHQLEHEHFPKVIEQFLKRQI